MATQLTIVNSVLRRLRETEVSTVAASDYSKLIGTFVNDAKETLEDMWFWTVNETVIDTTILNDSSTRTYDLTDTTDRSLMSPLMTIGNSGTYPYDIYTRSGIPQTVLMTPSMHLLSLHLSLTPMVGDGLLSWSRGVGTPLTGHGAPTGTHHRLSLQ